MTRIAIAAAVLLAAGSSCSGGHRAAPRRAPAVRFVPAGPILHRRCLAAARAVGYPIPCPTEVPSSMSYWGRLAYAESPPHQGWVGGSTTMGLGEAGSPFEHLVWTASPRPVRDGVLLAAGGVPAQRNLQSMGRVTIRCRRMHAVLVPETSENAFGSHVVLIWTANGHTYGIGFHDSEQFTCYCTTAHGLRDTLRLDEQLARHIALVGPGT